MRRIVAIWRKVTQRNAVGEDNVTGGERAIGGEGAMRKINTTEQCCHQFSNQPYK